MPIKPEKFPKDFNWWEIWVKHFRSIVNVNGWNDSQVNVTLTICLTSWAIEESERAAHRYVEQEVGYDHPIFEDLLKVLKPKMQR